MRKFLSILLIILLLLNVFGYYVLFMGWKYTNDLSMTRKLDDNAYDNAETITIKIPIMMPYATDSKDFERVNGAFEYNREFYRLVKQKFLQDTLYIVCVKDNANKKIHEALSGFVKTFSDKSSEAPSSSEATISLIKDYLVQFFLLANISFGWEIDIIKVSIAKILTPSFFPTIIQPPE